MKYYFKNLIFVLLFSLFFLKNLHSQDYRILESDNNHILIEFNFNNKFEVNDVLIDGIKFTKIKDSEYPLRKPGEPYLPTRNFQIGIPQNSNAVVTIQKVDKDILSDKFMVSTPDSIDQPLNRLNFDQQVYGKNSVFPVNEVEGTSEAIYRYIKIVTLIVSPFQFNPVERKLILNKRIVVKIDFKLDQDMTDIVTPISDKMTEDLVETNLINSKEALAFISKTHSTISLPVEEYWYNPNKDYYKVYLNKKGVYRITYDQLINSGISPSSGIQDGKLEIFNDGNSLPIDIVDVQEDGIFNSGDYFQFVGKPATPANQYTRLNIYNNSNVFWFSYQADSINSYIKKNGFRNSSPPSIQNTVETLTWEYDYTYQHLGHADNDQRDYWYWDDAIARNRTPVRDFIYWIKDSIDFKRVWQKPELKIRVGMHGLTSGGCLEGNGHSAEIKFNTKVLGVQQWNGQDKTVFEKTFYVSTTSISGDSVQFFEDQQKFEIIMNGNTCSGINDDQILINYIEFDYWRWNRTYDNYYYFKSPPNNFQENRYYLFGWKRDNMKIYIPSRGEFINNPYIQNDADKSVYFFDTISVQTDYYCIADDYFLSPDSIKHNISSDLRNTNNGADYIIITHKNFIQAAERLADYRSTNLKGIESPRIKVVDVDQIYNEFSYGLLAPNALNLFAKYAFENWQSPAPQYIALMGDMSYDYRKLFPSSRDNFIPSIPIHVEEGDYGQAPSDNGIVTVLGNDLLPEISIGRISCETLDEANLLVDKIINYPADVSKNWKQNVLLLSSGLTAIDEENLKFNDRNMELENYYLKPTGMKSSKVFRYPNKPEYIPFQGEGPDIRREIDNGAVVVNYYGHGGGAQWDLVFTNDDILELNNGDKLPFVISLTCYTAHFDNQEIFGEIFNSIPNKGSIAFLGSSGVTTWPSGHIFNRAVFKNIFVDKNYIIGNAINYAKANSFSSVGTLISVITLLGDPALELSLPYKSDFAVKSSGISITPSNPLVNDTVIVKLDIDNLGRSFSGDTLNVKLYERIISDTTLIGSVSLLSFAESDSATFSWLPKESGLISLIAIVNDDQSVPEDDFSDNTATNSFSIFDFGEPNIVKPANGYFSSNNKIDFIISDIGFYFNRDFNYLIKIYNSPEYSNATPIIQSPVLKSVDAIVKWNPGQLAAGEYFWRAIIYDEVDTNFSPIRIFTISENTGSGYLAQKSQLKLFNSSNMNYSNEFNSLVLNTELKPPYPSPKFLLDSIYFNIPPDQTEPSTFTTDGTYFYFGHLPQFTGGAKTKIYKIGTGLNGSLAGNNYGAIPNLEIFIYNNLMFFDGFIYSCTGQLDYLLKIDPNTGDTNKVIIPDSLLLTLATPTQNGGVYLYSDGQYVYNLGIGTSLHPNKFVLRKFDPSNNWLKVGEDVLFSGSIFFKVNSFIVVDDYLIVYENYNLISLRRYRISNGNFEEEWNYAPKIKDYFAIAYDHENDFVYFNAFRPGNGVYTPAFLKYQGTYKEASGQINSQEIGPASNWQNLIFDINQIGSTGKYQAYLFGKNKINKNWEPLDTLIQNNFSLQNLDAKKYNYIKLKFNFADSSFGAGAPMKFNSLKVNYNYLPEISLIPKSLSLTPDSLLQGFPVEMNLKIDNIGYTKADNLKLDFYRNHLDTAFYSTIVNVPADSFVTINKIISTDNLLYTAPVSPINVRVIATSPIQEYYTFNNESNGNFNVVRDSINPIFNITFDGSEIINGDIISSKPIVVITLQDNSPLPLTPTLFSIVLDNKLLNFNNPSDSLKFEYTDYPNSKAIITWTPALENGRHSLIVSSKDSSNNFSDATAYTIYFNVYNEPGLEYVYNYPNPFTDNTYFTFELHGINPPEEFKLKIFTIAGRLIKEFNNPPTLKIGFNKILWDGRDEDGDEIANGTYLYKIVSKQGGETKTVTQKLVKLK